MSDEESLTEESYYEEESVEVDEDYQEPEAAPAATAAKPPPVAKAPPSRPVHPLFAGGGAKNALAAAAANMEKKRENKPIEKAAPSPSPARAAAAPSAAAAAARPPHPLFGGGDKSALNDQIKMMAAKRNNRVESGDIRQSKPEPRKKSIDEVMPPNTGRSGGSTATASLADQVAMLAARRSQRTAGGDVETTKDSEKIVQAPSAPVPASIEPKSGGYLVRGKRQASPNRPTRVQRPNAGTSPPPVPMQIAHPPPHSEPDEPVAAPHSEPDEPVAAATPPQKPKETASTASTQQTVPPAQPEQPAAAPIPTQQSIGSTSSHSPTETSPADASVTQTHLEQKAPPQDNNAPEQPPVEHEFMQVKLKPVSKSPPVTEVSPDGTKTVVVEKFESAPVPGETTTTSTTTTTTTTTRKVIKDDPGQWETVEYKCACTIL